MKTWIDWKLVTGFGLIQVLWMVGCVTLPDIIDPVKPPVVVTTTTTTTTTTTIPPAPDIKQDPKPIHPANFSTRNRTIITKREGGYVNNADNSRKTVKTVFPEKYTDLISRCVYFTEAGFRDEPKRGPSHEVGNRERFYGTMPVSSYPNNMWVGWDTVVDGQPRDYCFLVANPRDRLGERKSLWSRVRSLWSKEDRE